MAQDHGNCPSCNADLNGGSIWQHFYGISGSEEEADDAASSYGATRTKGRWGRQIAIYSQELDRTTSYRCPDCNHEWTRR